MSIEPGNRNVRTRGSAITIGTVSSVLEADPMTNIEYGRTMNSGSFGQGTTTNNTDTTDNDITD